MSTPFDSMKRRTFDVTARIMGVDALWGELTARVLFNQPNATEERMDDINFTPVHFEMEYRIDDFPGLYQAVRDGEYENVTINSVEYSVRHVMRAHDGDTFKAHLVPN